MAMTVPAPVGDPPESQPAPGAEPAFGAPAVSREMPLAHLPDIHEICPYLAASDGAWRSASPHREHRCGAVEPPAPLSSDKQRRLCLSAEHASCATFRAARASRAAMLLPGVDPAAVAAADAARRPIARTSALILEHPRLSAPRARWPVDRAVSQVALIGLLIVAFVALAIARLSGPDAAGIARSSPSPSPSATASPSARPTPSPSPSPSAQSSASASAVAPSVAPSPSGGVSGVTATPPVATTTYVVKKGDTLYGIASTFGTTVAEIKRINGLKSNSLKIGQKLEIPKG
jgi:LysM repeat protein